MLWIPLTAWATHEADHRFTVYGYVRDAKGVAIEDARVMVVDTQIGEGSTAFTDRSGYYEVLLHLHSKNLGDEISITALDEVKKITATFDPEDKTTARMVQVDFGAVPAEKLTSSFQFWIYGTGAAIIVAAFLYWGVYSRRKARSKTGGWKKGKRK